MTHPLKIIYKLTHPLIKLYWQVYKPKTYGSRALILCNDQILLVKNISVNHWSLPGGKLNINETPEDCIKRELKEELNLDSISIDYKLGEYFSQKEGKRDTIHVFVINLRTPIFTQQWELEDAQWFSLQQLPVSTSSGAQKRIKEYLEEKREIKTDW